MQSNEERRRLALIVLTAAAVALPLTGQRSKTATGTKVDVLKQKLDKGEKVLVVDVRNDDEVKSGSIPGAVQITMSELEGRMKDIPKDIQIVFACDHGNRSSRAAELYEKNGYKTSTFCALDDWKAKNYKIGETRKPGPGPIVP